MDEDRTEHDEVAGLYQAWTVIANASEWLTEGTSADTRHSAEWREAARRWRDDVFHPALNRVWE